MKKPLLLFQFIITVLVLAFVPGNIAKTLILLPVWWLGFGGLNRRELVLFFLVNVFFVFNDIAAIQNNFFRFTEPDLFGLPYWEFFMWGFYLLYAYRFFPTKLPRSVDLKIILLAVFFALSFSLISDREVLLFVTSGILLASVILYHDVGDLVYCFFLMAMGTVIEIVGLYFNLWSYPGADNVWASVQFVVMWGGIGLYYRRIVVGWLHVANVELSVNRDQQLILPDDLQALLDKAGELFEKREMGESFKILSYVEMRSRKEFIPLNYRFYILFSQANLSLGNMRAAIENLREALRHTASSVERAYVYLQLCRIYRMMILMKNARSELKRAFAEMNMVMSQNSILWLWHSLLKYVVSCFSSPKVIMDTDEKKRLQIQIALNEEEGLSAYYFRENYILLQSPLRARTPAFQLGPSIQMINYLGGMACVLALLGWNSKAHKFMEKTLLCAKNMIPFVRAKAYLWQALFKDYCGFPKESAQIFETVLEQNDADLSPSDYRLIVTTLSCNYLIRGHMKSSEAVIRRLTDLEQPNCRYFSSGKAYIDWYRLPALSFLQGTTEAQEHMKLNSQIAFFRVDEEKWQITQYLGGLLVYHYSQAEKNISEIKECFKRFELLKLSPKNTYLEACHYWVAKSHLLIELASENKISFSEAGQAVKSLGKTLKHPNLKAHYLVAKSKYELLKNKKSAPHLDKFIAEAERLAEQNDNIWVQYEILRFNYLKHVIQNQSELAQQFQNKIHQFCSSHGWKGLLR